jgi:hypothetical protein
MKPVDEIIIKVRPNKKRFKRMTDNFKKSLHEKGFENVEFHISYVP